MRTLIDFKAPEATATYSPISHINAVTETAKEFTSVTGIAVRSIEDSTWKGGDRYHGIISTDVGDRPYAVPQIHVFNSYDKSIAFTIRVGMQVVICSNLMIGIDLLGSNKRKHTSEENLQGVFDGVFDNFHGRIEELDNKVIDMKEDICSERRASRYLIQCVQDKVFSSSDIMKVWNEYSAPTFDYGSNKKSLWNLYNATTHIAKNFQKQKQMEALIRCAYTFGLTQTAM